VQPDQLGVGLVGLLDPGLRSGRLLTEPDMSIDEPASALVPVQLAEPHLVERRMYAWPRLLVQQ
jgi:hypothetical protein